VYISAEYFQDCEPKEPKDPEPTGCFDLVYEEDEKSGKDTLCKECTEMSHEDDGG
jgi:hypothetical protein